MEEMPLLLGQEEVLAWAHQLHLLKQVQMLATVVQ
jgi:hypothetical protein